MRISISFNRISARRIYRILFFSTVVSIFLVAECAAGQSAVLPIVLKPEKVSFTPKEFYISDFRDQRMDKNRIGELLVLNSAQEKLQRQTVDLQGGSFQTFRDFFLQSVSRNPKLRPVLIVLKKCSVVETEQPGRIKGNVELVIDFQLQGKDKNISLIEYKGGAEYLRSVNGIAVVEPALRKSLIAGLDFFNNWINREADTNEKLAKGIKLIFEEYKKSADPDTVFYDIKRPLTWKDFRAPVPAGSRYAATIFPSLAYEGRSEVVKGFIELRVALKVFATPSSSWVRPEAKDSYSLNHEQRHFDIVKVVAERFKQKIKSEKLTLDNFDSILRYEYIESFREMNRLEDQYDDETGHGQNAAIQQKWNEKIDAELESFRVK
ncbi:hypothetical protein [Rubrolithibacter danxiaensis]|uniref:hypothetical protein n=1 Tax=Rubrolithibacter danxiaensis TaxID=3390805 RepID=UPI003BF862A8